MKVLTVGRAVPFDLKVSMCLSEDLLKAFVAIWLVVLFLESAFVELLQAEGAHKVFRVKFLEHGSNAATGDGLRTAGAERAALSMIMCLTVG